MQGLKSQTRSASEEQFEKDPISMLRDIEWNNAGLIGQVVEWFENAVSRQEEESFESAIKRKYSDGGRAAELYRKLKAHNSDHSDGTNLLSKTLDWIEFTVEEDRDYDCLDDAIEGVFDEALLELYLNMRDALGETDDGPSVESLSLPSAGLKIRDGAIQKMGSTKGTVVASFPFSSINGLWIKKSWNFFGPLAMTAFLVMLAAISKAFIPYEWLSWATAGSLAMSTLFCLAELRNHTVVVDTAHGVAKYPTNAAIADVESFVMSARQQIEGE